MIHTCFLGIRCKRLHQFLSEWELISRLSGIWTCLANVNMWVKFLSRHSEVFKIYTKYLSWLVDNQVYNMLFVPCALVCLHFRKKLRQTTAKSPHARRVTSLVEVLLRAESRLRYITWHIGRPVTSGLFLSCEKNSISNLHVVGMPLEWAGNLKFSYFAVLTIGDLWSPNVPNSIH